MTERQYSDDPKMLWGIIAFLLEGWEGAIHSRDSAFQVAQDIPDWSQRYQEALADPLRQQHTRLLFSPARKLIDALYEDRVTDSLLEQIVGELKKLPN